tara:strand:+ start:1111 stop:1569 length:459 start_codon:yes stop_codon:yes gene_type:complete
MSTMQKILDLDLRKILNPRTWLLVVLVSHTIIATIIPLLTSEADSNEFLAASYGLLISVVLATIYFIPEGQNQARMTAIIAGSVLLWILVNLIADSGNNFDLSVNLEPPFLYKFDFDLSLTPPILLWAFLSLSGFVYWNCESNQEKEQEAEA